MTREDFRSHYANYSLAWISPDTAPPCIDNFRYFNSGVILGHRSEFSKVVSWAINTISRSEKDHQVGEHMIADQDYFQLWANNFRFGCCTTLPWYWNHCQLWDKQFPRPGAFILHFSNFCLGPDSHQIIMSYFFFFFLRLKEKLSHQDLR